VTRNVCVILHYAVFPVHSCSRGPSCAPGNELSDIALQIVWPTNRQQSLNGEDNSLCMTTCRLPQCLPTSGVVALRQAQVSWCQTAQQRHAHLVASRATAMRRGVQSRCLTQSGLQCSGGSLLQCASKRHRNSRAAHYVHAGLQSCTTQHGSSPHRAWRMGYSTQP
jgi:hypothetical protein